MVAMVDQQGEQASGEQRVGRHAAPDDPDTTESADTVTGAPAAETPTETPTEAQTETQTETPAETPAETPTELTGSAPSEVPTQDVRGSSPADGAPTALVATPDRTQQIGASGAPTRREEVPQAEPTRRMEPAPGPPPAPAAPPSRSGGGRRGAKRVLHGVATLLRVVGLLLALVLVAFVVLTLVGVNPDNGIAQVVAAGADGLVMRFRDLFLPADPQLAVAVNYGAAALFWLVAGLVAARLVRTLARLL